ALLVGAVAAGGCAGRMPEPKAPTMVRSFSGTLVPGYYVTPSAYEHYLRAQLLSNDGRAEEAADQLRQAIAADGASAYLRTRLAEELLTLGHIDEAREEIEASLHLDGQFAEAYVDMARVKLRLGDMAGAEGALKRAIDVDRTCEDAYVLLVNLYRERGQESKVQETWRALAQHVPGSAPAQHALARLAIARGDWKTAEAELQKALELDGNLGEAREELAELYQAEGRIDDALSALADAYDRSGDGKTAEHLVRLQMATGHADDARGLVERLEDEGGGLDRKLWVGWRWLDARQPERARGVADAALKVSDSPAAHLLMGRALDALGQTDEAIAQLGKVPPRATQYVAAQSLIGRLLRDRGRYREAAENIGRAIVSVTGAEPGSASDALQDALAQVHERAGDHAQAVKLLEQAFARRPQSQELAFALGAAYQRNGQWERAVETVRGAILKRDADNVQALNFIGYALASEGQRLDEARRLLEHALQLKPMSGEVADSLGWLYVKINRLDDAERLLVRADRLTPADPEILEHLGDLYVKRSDRARAVEAYKRALKNKPDDKARHVIEEELLQLETGKLAVGSGSR
ncbi:MAG: tetratricopeptide repeat protein, partial [Polyangia bacterium]